MSHQPLVLAIEPDMRQAAILKRIVTEKVLAAVTVVDSRDAAIDSIRTAMPDVLLLTALLSPRDEEELMAHLRTLDNAGHLQTHTIPQLASSLGPSEGRSRGLFSAFRRKKDVEAPVAGCDPDLFAEEIRLFLQHAEERRRELETNPQPIAHVRMSKSERDQKNQPAVDQSTDAAESSSWDSPFEWKPTTSRAAKSPAPERAAAPTPIEPFVPEPMAADPDPAIYEPAADVPFAPERAADAPFASEPIAEEPLAAAPMAAESIVNEPVNTEPLVIEPVFTEPIVQEPMDAAPIVAETRIDDAPILEDVIAAAAEPEAPRPLVNERVGKVIGDARIVAESSDPWVVHAPRRVTIEAADVMPVVSAPLVNALPEIEVVLEPQPAHAASVEPIAIALDPAPVEPPPPSPVHERAVKIVARVQDEAPSRQERLSASSEWTRPQAPPEGVNERLGPLALWARYEARKSKPAQVTADDVRALIASLAIPTAVASVTYPRGCRIRRVRVPAAPDTDQAESVGPVILSRRALAERRDKHTTA